MNIIYCGLGFVFVVFGFIGIVIPILPTTPFLLLAAWCFSHGSEKWNDWLLNHKILGPFIRNFQEKKGISRGHKRFAYLILWLSFTVSILLLPILWVKVSLAFIGLVLTGLLFSFKTLD